MVLLSDAISVYIEMVAVIYEIMLIVLHKIALSH